MAPGCARAGVIAEVKAEREIANAKVINGIVQGKKGGAQVESVGILAEGVLSAMVEVE